MSAILQMTDKTFSLDLGILLMDKNPLLRRNLKSKFKSGGYSNILSAEILAEINRVLASDQAPA